MSGSFRRAIDSINSSQSTDIERNDKGHAFIGGGRAERTPMRTIVIQTRKRMLYAFVSVALLTLAGAIVEQNGHAQTPAARQTENVIVVMLDGLRWEEVFRGADPKLIEKRGPRSLGAAAQRTSLAKELYWRETPEERRKVLMPFLWDVMATDGQVYGNRELGSDAHVKNHHKFSYPGYSETLTGYADARVHSNRNIPNPNATVMEWLNGKPAFAGKVAAFGAWQLFQGIFNQERCGFVVNTCYAPLTGVPVTAELTLLNTLKTRTAHVWADESFDQLPFYTAIEYLKVKKPRVMFIGLGETDDWAHMGAYPEYLNAANRDDAYLRELWNQVQAMPEYRGRTTLVVLPDHGRGSGPLWTSHAWVIPGSGQTWMAFLGPDTPALGEREQARPVTESQIAATVAALLGEDYHAAVPRAGAPIADVLGDSRGNHNRSPTPVAQAVAKALAQRGPSPMGTTPKGWNGSFFIAGATK
jgi:hypothetical protein